jgi:hypothetical protein
MADIGRQPVDTVDVIGEDARGPQDFDEHGRFRWPKAIVMIRAWRFEPQPRLLDVLAEQLPYNATPQAVELSSEDTRAVMALTAVEVELPPSKVLTNARLLDKALGAARPTTGPTPSSWNSSTGRDVNRRAFTYVLRFGKTDIWKIGHAVDVVERTKQVNWHIPPEVVPQTWRPILTQPWDNEVDAHAMEQRVLKALARNRTEGERVRCSESEVWSAWKAAIGI